MTKCPFCGFENEDGALFCEQCKSDLSAVPAPTASPAPDTVPMAALLEEGPMAAIIEAAPADEHIPVAAVVEAGPTVEAAPEPAAAAATLQAEALPFPRARAPSWRSFAGKR